jgi:hypothetical protein
MTDQGRMQAPTEAVVDADAASGPGEEPRSRRAILAAGLGAAGAWVASGIAGARPVQAASGSPMYAGRTNTAVDTTTVTNIGGGQTGTIDGLHGVSSVGGSGLKGTGKFGVLGISSTTGGFGVWGQHTGSGNGLNGDSATGAGVHGKSTSGYGGLFEGGKAQVRLVPKSTSGRPTTGSHAKGELYLGSTGNLYICVASGTPGTWRKVTTTSA